MSESQKLVLLVSSGVAGLLIGSFLNVCIFRLPRNCMSIVRPRSRCTKCLHPIVWYDNLPVLSWILLGGRCRFCKGPISPRYALIELLTGALYLYAGWKALYGANPAGWNPAVGFAVQAWFLGALVVCTFVDLDFRILPDEVTISGIVIGLAVSAAFPFLQAGGLPPLPFVPEGGLKPHVQSLVASGFGALIGWGTIFAVGVLGKALFRKRIARLGETEAMGFGDVKYMAMLGAVLGWRGVLLVLVIACLIGAVFGLGKLIVVRRMGYVPFGPFLSAGALAMVFWEKLVWQAIRGYMGVMDGFSRWLLRTFSGGGG